MRLARLGEGDGAVDADLQLAVLDESDERRDQPDPGAGGVPETAYDACNSTPIGYI